MEKVEDGCPMCGGDVAGDEDSKYYCDSCNLLFSGENLEMEPAEGDEGSD